ncbi:unnamed protein product [Brassica rapa subsp. trilocularis]
MSTPARKRLMRDFKRLQQDPPAGISGAPQDNNIMLWNASFKCDSLLWYTQSLLCDPNTNSSANSEAALMYSENKREYNRRVRDVVEQSWTTD